MELSQWMNRIERHLPPHYQEDFDNTGLLIGNPSQIIKGVLITLDVTEAVLEEALEKGCNLIYAFHPIIFKGLKKIAQRDYVERITYRAIKSDLAVYASHTRLDNHPLGLHRGMADILDLSKGGVLVTKKSCIKKLTTYVPATNLEPLRTALFKAGAGRIGKYNDCSFTFQGEGSFKPGAETNPFLGKKNVLHREKETCLSVVFEDYLESEILAALRVEHPYEEVAYEVITLDNTYQDRGIGFYGELPQMVSESDFLVKLREVFGCPVVRHSKLLNRSVQRIAVLGGSGSFAIEHAKRVQADVLVTSDLKYHDFFRADGSLLLADIGHYESERHIKNIMREFLQKIDGGFSIFVSQIETNPIFYSFL